VNIEFVKMQGTGNDYIYIDCTGSVDISLSCPQIQAMCDRHYGIGADGVIFIRKSNVAVATMDMHNRDGSKGSMCGNGVRCVGKFLYDRYYDDIHIDIDTSCGIKKLEIITQDGSATGARVDMGTAVLQCDRIPVLSEQGNIDIPLEIGGQIFECTCVSMGNPHAVVFTDCVESIDLDKIGSEIETHPAFPERVNVEFVRVISDSELQMRVWERGTGETKACGTGACAAVVAGVLKGFCKYDRQVTVHLPGGDLDIVYYKDGRVEMTGDAVEVFCGSIEVDETEILESGNGV